MLGDTLGVGHSQKKHPLSSARWDVLIFLGMHHSSGGTPNPFLVAQMPPRRTQNGNLNLHDLKNAHKEVDII
jgi:hypothetical protein